MTEANAEYRRLPHELADVFVRVVAWLRIARAVGEEDAVRAESHHLFRRGHGRNHRDATTAIDQHAQDVLLDAEVIGHDVLAGRLVFYADDLRRLMRARTGLPLVALLGRDDLGQVGAVHLGNGSGLGDKFLRIALD